MDDFELFMENVYKFTNIDLRKYKRAQMQRRLTSLRDKHGYRDFGTYFTVLQQNQTLFHEFLDRMTINVSEFFRNPNRWEVIENRLFPEILAKTKKVKVWSAACSTGEEPYTLALLLSRFLPVADFQILATDIDENVIAKAKQGIYHQRSLQFVPPDLLQKHFRPLDHQMYAISDEIKKCVEFRKHNLLEDPFEPDQDLIVCRNVIIYFTEDAKNILYRKFSKALKPNGVLFVGSTEQIFNPQEFHLRSYDTFFYQRYM